MSRITLSVLEATLWFYHTKSGLRKGNGWKEYECRLETDVGFLYRGKSGGVVKKRHAEFTCLSKLQITKVVTVDNPKDGKKFLLQLHHEPAQETLIAFPDSPTRNQWRRALLDMIAGSVSMDFKLSEEDIDYGPDGKANFISKGAGGVVKQAVYKGAPVAVKVLFPQMDVDEVDAMREISVLCELSAFPYFVSFMGFFRNPEEDSYALVMEFMPYGSLENALRDDSLSLLMKLKVMRDVCIGMNYLHSKNMCHRDIKPDNVLLCTKDPHTKGVCAKLTDFGESKSFKTAPSNSRRHTMNRGTPVYMAPEIIQQDYDPLSADVYSFGKMLYRVVSSLMPTMEAKVPHLSRKLLTEDPIHLELDIIIQQCCDTNPQRRPDFEFLHKKILELIDACSKNHPAPSEIQSDSADNLQIPRSPAQHVSRRPTSSQPPPPIPPRSEERPTLLGILDTLSGVSKSPVKFVDFAKRVAESFYEQEATVLQLYRLFLYDALPGDVHITRARIEAFEKWFGHAVPNADPCYIGYAAGPPEVTLRPGEVTLADAALLSENQFFHGAVERAPCESQLVNEPPGTFLIRMRSTAPGEFVLSLRVSNKKPEPPIQHCIIKKKRNTYELLGNLYTSLAELVEHHMSNPVIGYHMRTKELLFSQHLTTAKRRPPQIFSIHSR